MNLAEQARLALGQGDFASVARAAQTLVSQCPEEPEGYFLLGLAAAETGQIGKGISLIDQAIAHGPRAEYLAQLARLLIMVRRDGQAGEAARKALEIGTEDALTSDTIGCVLARLGDHQASLAPFIAAVAAEPDNLEYRYNLAAACGFTGKVEEARLHYEVILAADPGNARAHYALSILSRQTIETNHVDRLVSALAGTAKPADTLRIRYALAKELEDIGQADRAFAHLSAANAAYKRASGYDFAQDEAIFGAIERLFGESSPLTGGKGCDGEAPIFIVGMPRTGTTLVDRILSSHVQVESAGELQAMPLAVKQATGTSSRTVIDPETVAASGGCDPRVIGEAYLARAAHNRPHGKPRFVDKLPANFLYVGHIAHALPKARIVCLRRNPMDTVWSNFRNLFATQSAYYAYSYDLMDTARYYARFDRLMAMWDRLLPGRVLQFGYEALVHDQETETRRLLEHCGLTWDSACLDFHENRAAVATPSAAQVRRKLNADGIGRWKTHAGGMADVRAFFAAEGIAID